MARSSSVRGELSVQTRGKLTVIELPAASLVNRTELEHVCEVIDRVIESTNPPEILLSFANVTYVSSTFLGKIIAFNKKAKLKGGRLALSNVSDQLYALFVVTKLNSQILIYRPGQKVFPTTIAWVTLFSVMSGSAVIGLLLVFYLGFNRSQRGTPFADWVAWGSKIYFFLTIPLAVVVFLTRRAFVQLERNVQWVAVAVFSILALALFLALFLAR